MLRYLQVVFMFFGKRYRQKLHDFLLLRTWPFRSSPQWASTVMHSNVHLPRNLRIRGLRDLRSDEFPQEFQPSCAGHVEHSQRCRNNVWRVTQTLRWKLLNWLPDSSRACFSPGIPVPNSTETGWNVRNHSTTSSFRFRFQWIFGIGLGLCREFCPATRFKPGTVNEHGQAQRHNGRPVQLAMSHRSHQAPMLQKLRHGCMVCHWLRAVCKKDVDIMIFSKKLKEFNNSWFFGAHHLIVSLSICKAVWLFPTLCFPHRGNACHSKTPLCTGSTLEHAWVPCGRTWHPCKMHAVV